MKKNKMMRVASVLLVAVLLTTSIISGTFAKYVTEGSAEDSARVAKFGVVVEVSGSLFDDTYDTDDADADGDDDEVSVLSSDSSNVVAPGTANDEGLTIDVSGEPEVDVLVKIELDVEDDIFLAANDDLPDMTTSEEDATFENEDDYYPLVFTLTGDIIAEYADELNDTDTYGEVDDDTVVGTLAQIEAVIGVINADGDGIYVNAGDDLADEIGELNLTWAWAFSDTDSAAGDDVDKADTLLGNLAAGTAETELTEGDDYCLDVSVSLTVSVTQVD